MHHQKKSHQEKNPPVRYSLLAFAISSCLASSNLYASPLWSCVAENGQWHCNKSGAQTVAKAPPARTVRKKGSKKTSQAAQSSSLKASRPPMPALAVGESLDFSSPVALAGLLGWTKDPKTTKNLCGGYYVEPAFDLPLHPKPISETATNVTASHGRFAPDQVSLLIGDVRINQPGRQLTGEKLYLYPGPTGKKPEYVRMLGRVHMREPGVMLAGDRGEFDLTRKSGWLDHALYRMAFVNPTYQQEHTAIDEKKKSQGNLKLYHLNGWGTANSIHQLSPGVFALKKATYGTCPPGHDTWRLHASTINLNRNTGRGEAYNAHVDIHGVPVFYLPYINFPIDKRRKSGFLYPVIGSNSDSGVIFGLPYYWNLAPNYDATLNPVFMSHRGLQLNGQFRYLTQDSKGEVIASILPNDKRFRNFQRYASIRVSPTPTQADINRLQRRSDTRKFLFYKNSTQFNQHLSSNIYYHYVSDSYFFQDDLDSYMDLGDTDVDTNDLASMAIGNSAISNTDDENHLLRRADLNFVSEHWNVLGILQAYQTLHPINQAAIANQYSRLPEIDWSANYGGEPFHLNFTPEGQFVKFTYSKPPGNDTVVTTGSRTDISPTLSFPMSWSGGYITPQLQVQMMKYYLHNQAAGFSNDEPSRILPIFDIDSGLYFDRSTSFGKTPYTQTLEPRLFYLYVPYRNQNAIPDFDTSFQPFSAAQLFMTNNFSGLDRQQNANQVTLALTTRFLNAETGIQKFTATVGSIYYFQNRKVTLCTTNGCWRTENPLAHDSYSPIAGSFDYQFYDSWHANGQMAYSIQHKQTQTSNVGFYYQPDNRHLFNVSYNFSQEVQPLSIGGLPVQRVDNPGDKTEQVNTSVLWPLSDHWSLYGLWQYNLNYHNVQSEFAGFQYNTCCWAFRLVGGRNLSYQQPLSNAAANTEYRGIYNHFFYFQFALKGLGNVGRGNVSSLLTDISGYQDTFGDVAPGVSSAKI